MLFQFRFAVRPNPSEQECICALCSSTTVSFVTAWSQNNTGRTDPYPYPHTASRLSHCAHSLENWCLIVYVYLRLFTRVHKPSPHWHLHEHEWGKNSGIIWHFRFRHSSRGFWRYFRLYEPLISTQLSHPTYSTAAIVVNFETKNTHTIHTKKT